MLKKACSKSLSDKLKRHDVSYKFTEILDLKKLKNCKLK